MGESEIRYCTTGDGVRIAYKRWGSGPPLVFIVPMPGSIELEMGLPMVRAFYDALSSRFELFRFDWRGTGASQREGVADMSFAAASGDVAALADHLQLGAFSVFAGPAMAAQAAVRYAADHPTRVDRMILWEPLAVIRSRRDETSIAYRTLVANEWQSMTRVFGEEFVSDRPKQERSLMTRLYRETMTPESLLRGWDLETDVTDDLPKVTAPTLILHARRDRQIALDESRVVAATMPDARLVPIDAHHAYFFAWHEQIVPRVLEFLAPEGADALAPSAAPPFRTVLFTDVVRNTPLLQRLGDEAWREVMREHEAIVRGALAEHGGTEISTAGDSFFASFPSAVRAVQCAVEMQRAFASRNATADHAVEVRMGLNAGEPIADGDELMGTAVTLAARVMAEAQGGEILVADVVRQLVAGKGFVFGERGEFVPKGFDEAVRLFEVRWQA